MPNYVSGAILLVLIAVCFEQLALAQPSSAGMNFFNARSADG